MSRPRVVEPVGSGKVELLYNPYQQEFLKALRLRLGDDAMRRAYTRLALFAGRRGGKTLIGGLAAVTEAGARPGQVWWVCTGSYPKLHDYVIPAVKRYLPKSWLAKPFSESHYEWTLKNETIIQARSLDDVNRGRGPGLDGLWIDEARDVAQVAWKTLVPALVDKRGVAIITTTPSGFDWCVASGTFATTYRGQVQIERLRVGDRVWTRAGWKRVAHVTYMGEKETVVIEAGGRTLRCTPDHKIATPSGWVDAEALVGAAAGLSPALPTAPFSVAVAGGVGVAPGTGHAEELPLHPRSASKVLCVRDGLQMGGVRPHTAPVPTDVIQFQAGGDWPVHEPVGQASGALLAVPSPNPSHADESVPLVLAGAEAGAGPLPTAGGDDGDLGHQPGEIELEAVEVSRVSHGVILPVWDIGVEGEHEFLAGGVLVHNCYEAFWSPAADLVPGYWACKYKTAENPSIDAAEIEAAKRDMDPLFFQQEFEAEFVSFTGAIYGDVLGKQLLETDAAVKLLIPEWPKVDPSRPVLVGIDPGADHPFAGVVIVGTEKGLVVVGEYLSRDSAAIKHAQGLFSMLQRSKLSSAQTWAIDRSQKQMAIELAQHGIYTTQAENDVVAGIQRVKSWLFAGRLYLVRERCPKLVQQMFSYRWAENLDGSGQAKRERVVKINDDLPDALRYAVMTWPETPYPADPIPLRSLEGVPDKDRWALEKLQRMDHPELFADEDNEALDTPGLLAEDDSNPSGDFWG